MRDPYEVLDIPRNASDADVKTAFRRLAAKYHPDRNPEDPSAQSRFKEVNAAHQILSDPKKRAVYDRFGKAAFDAAGGGFPQGVDLGSIDGIFGDILSAIGIKTGDRGDIKKKVKVSFEDAALGCETEVEYPRVDLCGECNGRGAARGTKVDTCSACGGRGRVRFQQGMLPFAVERVCSSCKGSGRIPKTPCSECQGSGLVKKSRTLTVTLPAGIEAGSSRVVERAGSRTSAESPPGDLELIVEVKPHPFFERQGDDVLCAAPITFAQAALGGEFEVPTLDGKVKVRVPPATQTGSILRIKGKGVPHRLRSGRGDQLVEVNVEIPTKLTERAKELIEELGGELGEDVQPQQRTFVEKLKGLFG